jgi:ethanolaminephosphotransferase
MSARRERGENANTALLGLLPFFSSWALIVSYLALNPRILHEHLVPFTLYVGLINAYSVGQMITAVSSSLSPQKINPISENLTSPLSST